MASNKNISPYKLIYAVVNFGKGSEVLRIARENGISGGTILLGRGTVRSGLLNFFALYEIRKEIVLIVANNRNAKSLLEALDREMMLDRPDHGIAFTVDIQEVEGSKELGCNSLQEGRGEKEIMYQLITVIVDRGKAEEVIDTATEMGSKGGTVINARGSGVHERSTLFAMEIEPEKEIVMIVSNKELTQTIVNKIREKLRIDEPGKGIIFIQNVGDAYGLLK
ncbi:nitrogen regulatory protein PII [Mesotoga prima MesG1.Ag.4.2]|uniref:Nitrogen regulatory protein PII n=1 Tax=Mesotoga prima MesG1.Ag.4.2 TaxID=660470 RepID=I2F7I2_9BACT|nr:P-II family nitrogen regulator [Mesotoga prima]AFK07885.1 nitrogen regulatory protein PII [Mesotoga prima MesG1.Ag.4.2]